MAEVSQAQLARARRGNCANDPGLAAGVEEPACALVQTGSLFFKQNSQGTQFSLSLYLAGQ